MSPNAPWARNLWLRAIGLLAPPAGLIILWRREDFGLGRKIIGTLTLAIYSIPYTVALLLLLVRFGSLKIEWPGGYLPHFTYAPTVPNYQTLEANRATHKPVARTVVKSEAAYWTGFQGPLRDGHYAQMPILTNWMPTGPRCLWRQPIGGGYASFAMGQGLAFTIEQRREQEFVVAYDLMSGEETWATGWLAHFDESMGGDGPRATPAFDEGFVYALGGEGDLKCLNADTGKIRWERNILRDSAAGNLFYGTSASPLIVEGKLIVQPGGSGRKSVLAYNKTTGEIIWGALDDEAAYSSPMIVELDGVKQILVVTQRRAAGLSISNGKLLWEHPWTILHNNRNIAQPVVLGRTRIFLSGGYGTGCEAVDVRKSGSGWKTEVGWKNTFLKNKFTSSVFADGFIYGLDEDILTCLDAETGKRRWKEGRYGYGQILLASQHLVILCGDGELALVQASPDSYKEIFRCSGIHGKTWNHPAIEKARLWIRNAAEMACFDLSPH